ncbi:MAG: hypothetical protein IJ272_02515 [Clostridia bacterium]|nr:hypothetical protein [Clostridia bacterium]
MCDCCNGVGHEFESHGMKCKIVIRGNIMSVCLPYNATDLAVEACPLCGRNLVPTDKGKCGKYEERKTV